MASPSSAAFSAGRVLLHDFDGKTSVDALRSLAASGGAQAKSCEPFYVIDLGDICRKYTQWTTLMPRVKPFYAAKCNSDDVILDALTALGTGFDCASKAEMESVLSRGVRAEDIIFAHPCKPISHLQFAQQAGVRKMTFDNDQELVKIKRHYPDAELVLRILVDDSYSACRFGTKFGAHADAVEPLLLQAQALGLAVVGVSFHVGSGCCNAVAFSLAVERARRVFDQATALGFAMTLLDIGGGFPGTPDAPVAFEDIAHELNTSLAVHFPEETGVTLMAEPGRYFVASAAALAVNIVSRRDVGEHDRMYYVNDGVYGSFNCILFDHQVCHARPLFAKAGAAAAAVTGVASVWGPTCDSMDCITKEASLPVMELGEWLYFENMGAYTMAAGSTFNGFPRPANHYICTPDADADAVGVRAPLSPALASLATEAFFAPIAVKA